MKILRWLKGLFQRTYTPIDMWRLHRAIEAKDLKIGNLTCELEGEKLRVARLKDQLREAGVEDKKLDRRFNRVEGPEVFMNFTRVDG